MAVEGEIIDREEKHRELMEGLLGAEWPREKALEVADLALHASEKMCDVLKETAALAAMPIAQQQVFILAAEIMFQKMETILDFADSKLTLYTLDQIQERVKQHKSYSS